MVLGRPTVPYHNAQPSVRSDPARLEKEMDGTYPDFLRLLGTFDDKSQRMIGPLEMQFGMRSIVVQAASVEAV